MYKRVSKAQLAKTVKTHESLFRMHCSDDFIVEASDFFGYVLLKAKSLVGAFYLSEFRAIVFAQM